MFYIVLLIHCPTESKRKCLLAALFLKENSFLLIDEPTNHLDMNARKLVSDYLKYQKWVYSGISRQIVS